MNKMNRSGIRMADWPLLGALAGLLAGFTQAADIPSFQQDVMPVFMRAGCNTGACHGSARGQDGFHLSLFGYDAKGDYHRITRELSGRRINLAAPPESLLLLKTAGKVEHTGGKRLDESDPHYQTLLRWIEAGAPMDEGEIAKPVALTVTPEAILLEGKGLTEQLEVHATYSDGSERDVTDLAVFLSNNDSVASASDTGLVTSGERGESFVMARFSTFTAGTPVIVTPDALPFEFPEVETANFIDEEVHAKLQKLRIVPSDLCSDEVFLRRVTLDLTGTLPTLEERASFLADKDPEKRSRLIDALLERPDFLTMWVMKWSELLRIRTNNNFSEKNAIVYYEWLREQVNGGRPINEIAAELVSASGSSLANPAANYYHVERDNLTLAENAAQTFLGIQMQCAQCHNHPFDRWTMDDYRGFMAFFTQVGRKDGVDPRDRVIFNRGGGEAKHPVTNEPVAPKFPGGDRPDTKNQDRRVALSDWLRSPENPYFPRHVANLLWSHFFGRGIVEPVDDVRVSNPPSNPLLLDSLAARLIDYDFDVKELARDICNSRTYQLSSQTNATNATDDANFSHAMVRRLRAEVLLDCITQATGSRYDFGNQRAIALADGRTSSYFLTTFGRAKRETVACSEVKVEPTLSQALHLINGNTIHGKIAQGKRIQTLLAEEVPPHEIVQELYLRTLSREATPEELDALEPVWSGAEKPTNALRDIFWALLNSKEFLFNH